MKLYLLILIISMSCLEGVYVTKKIAAAHVINSGAHLPNQKTNLEKASGCKLREQHKPLVCHLACKKNPPKRNAEFAYRVLYSIR